MTVRAAARGLLESWERDEPHEFERAIDALRAALEQDTVEVPRVPTYEMVQAGAKLVKENLPYVTGTRAIYLAMLEAAAREGDAS